MPTTTLTRTTPPTSPVHLAQAVEAELERHAIRMAELAAGLMTPLGYRIVLAGTAAEVAGPAGKRAEVPAAVAPEHWCPTCAPRKGFRTLAALLGHQRAKHGKRTAPAGGAEVKRAR